MTLSGIVIDANLEQPKKAPSPILVKLLLFVGKVIDVNLEQLWKAELSLLVTLFGIVIDVNLDNQRKSHYQYS